MSEKPRYEFDRIAEAGYITAPHSEGVDPNSQIRIDQMIVDLSDRGTIRGVELLGRPNRRSMHSQLIRERIDWEEYEQWVWGQIEEERMERLKIAERVSRLEIIIQVPGNPANN